MKKLTIRADLPSGTHLQIATIKDGEEKLQRIELNGVEQVVMGVLIDQFLADRGIEHDGIIFDMDNIFTMLLRKKIKEAEEAEKESLHLVAQ